MSHLIPLGERLVIKPIVEEKTSGGIILTTEAQEAPSRGTVIAIADDAATPYVNIGDVVLHGKYSGSPVKVDGENLLILSAKDILARVVD